MKDGFIKVAAATPDIEVGNTAFNTEHILSCMQQAQKEHVKLLVFPELCISGYTCNDLFLQDILLDGCLAGLEQIRSASAAMDMVIVAGLPFLLHARLYNVAAVLFRGRLLGLVPKQHTQIIRNFTRHATSHRHRRTTSTSTSRYSAHTVIRSIRRKAVICGRGSSGFCSRH